MLASPGQQVRVPVKPTLPRRNNTGEVLVSQVHLRNQQPTALPAGVTVLSSAEEEYAETRLKLARMRAALGA